MPVSSCAPGWNPWHWKWETRDLRLTRQTGKTYKNLERSLWMQKQAEQALENANRELERRVRERTAALAASNDRLRREVELRRRAEESLRCSEQELRGLAAELLSAQEQERSRISRELHDTIGQSLAAVKFTVENLLARDRGKKAPSFDESCQAVIRVVRGSIEELRRIQKTLRPPTLDDLGIIATISWFCREISGIYPALRIARKIGVTEQEVPDRLRIVIYRILQEALINAARHSGAETVSVTLRGARGRLELAVCDHGVGFDPAAATSRRATDGHFGLLSMRERAELSAGSLEIESSPGKGTTIRASWKCRPAGAPRRAGASWTTSDGSDPRPP